MQFGSVPFSEDLRAVGEATVERQSGLAVLLGPACHGAGRMPLRRGWRRAPGRRRADSEAVTVMALCPVGPREVASPSRFAGE